MRLIDDHFLPSKFEMIEIVNGSSEILYNLSQLILKFSVKPYFLKQNDAKW